MRRTLIPALIAAAILVISAAAVFSHPGWRGVRAQAWDKDDLVTLEGEVADVGRPTAAIKADGKEYILHLGPFWHREDEKYPFERGQTVKVTGVVEEIYGRLHVYPHTIESEGESITLVDEDGVPVSGEYCHEYSSDRDWHGRMHGRRGHGRGHMWGW